MEAAYNEVLLNGLKRLPNWNSLKIKNVQLAWSNNACAISFLCENRFGSGDTPSFEEVVPFFRRFLTEATWSKRGIFWGTRDVKNSVRFKDDIFGEIQQAVCISSNPKNCKNN